MRNLGTVRHPTAPSVLFRVDAGPGIGLGHLQRCLSLATALAESGCGIAFVVNDPPIVSERIAGAGWRAVRLGGRMSWTSDDADRVIEEIAAVGATIVVVDSDLESADYMRRLRAAGVILCAVEDNSNEEVVAHVLLNGDAHAERQTYRSEMGGTEYLLGPSFTPLAKEYWAGTPAEAAAPPRALLVTLGGSDPHGLLPSLVDAASGLPGAIHVHVVVGPFTGRRQDVDAAVRKLAGRVTLHVGPASMHSIIASCDLALSAAGQTLYELAALGRPAVAIEVAANQGPQLDAFVRCGAVISAGVAADESVGERAVAMAATLASDPARLRSMAAAGRRFIDGRGACRAATALLSHCGPHVHDHSLS